MMWKFVQYVTAGLSPQKKFLITETEITKLTNILVTRNPSQYLSAPKFEAVLRVNFFERSILNE